MPNRIFQQVGLPTCAISLPSIGAVTSAGPEVPVPKKALCMLDGLSDDIVDDLILLVQDDLCSIERAAIGDVFDEIGQPDDFTDVGS